MLDSIAGLLLCGIMGYLLYVIILKPSVDYEKLPTYKDYVTKNPNILTTSGVKCVHCGSQSIKSWGNKNGGDKNRTHICNKCGEKLYRTRV